MSKDTTHALLFLSSLWLTANTRPSTTTLPISFSSDTSRIGTVVPRKGLPKSMEDAGSAAFFWGVSPWNTGAGMSFIAACRSFSVSSNSASPSTVLPGTTLIFVCKEKRSMS